MGPRLWSRKVWAVAGLVVIGAVAVFAVAAMHYNDTVLDANVCPQVAAVNAVLRTTLDTVSGVQFSDLHSCQYAEGADPRALWIDAAVPTGRASSAGAPCRHRLPLTVAGDPACSVAGSRDTTAGRPSLYVETRHADWQFTTNLTSVSMARLETLARTLLDQKRSLFS